MPPKLLDNTIAVALPLQIAEVEGVGVITGLGLTVMVLLADIVPHEPPPVVSVKVTVAGAEEDAVYVVVLGVLPPLFAKVPPAPPSDQTAEVAPPPNEPPKAAEVVP